MWISRKELDALVARIKVLECYVEELKERDTEPVIKTTYARYNALRSIWGKPESVKVTEVVELILKHLKLDLNKSSAKPEIASLSEAVPRDMWGYPVKNYWDDPIAEVAKQAKSKVKKK